MKQYLSGQKGFTLVELLLYVAISTVIILSVVGLIQVVLEARVKHQTVSEVEQQGQQAAQLIGQNLRNSGKVCSPALGASGTTLSVDPTGTACTTVNVFDISSGALRIKEGAAAAVNLTNTKVTVSGLSVKNLGLGNKGSAQVKFTITYNYSGSRNEYVYTKNFETAGSSRCPGPC